MRIIYEVLSGSHAYGLNHSHSDKDIRGIFVPSTKEVLGFGYKETRERKPDKVYHSLRKYLGLALQANPSILAWLWIDPSLIRRITECATAMRMNRQKLLSRRCRNTFGGYAISQLKKMEKSQGMPTGYALHGERDAASDPPSAKAGYDTKNAMHLIRILRCGISLLERGEYELYRGRDRGELLAIRAGKWRIEEVIREATSLMTTLDIVAEASLLPKEPDKDFWEEFLIKWHSHYLEGVN